MSRLRVSGFPRAGAACALAAGLLAGCATSTIERVAAPLKPPRAASLEEVLEAHEAYCNGIRSVSASGDLDVRDLRAGKARKLGVRVVAAREGRLYIKGSVLLVTALEVVADGERFWFQVPSRKTVWTGRIDAPPQAEGADQAPYYALRPADVTDALLPAPLAPGAGEALILDADLRSFRLRVARLVGGLARGLTRREVSLDRESLRLVGGRRFDEKGELVSELSVGDWTEAGPRRLVLSRPSEGYVAAFRFDKLEPNANVPERAFSPRTPAEYKVVEVGTP